MSTPLLLEAFAVLSSIVAVSLQVRQHPWGWPLTLVGVTAYAILLMDDRLYGLVGLQLVFFAQGVYGWWFWLHGGRERQEPPIRRMGSGEWLSVIAAIGLGTAGLGWSLSTWMESALPWPEATIFALSLTANLLLARKVLENWILWIAVNVLSIGVFLYAGRYLSAGLYLAFLGLAIAGLLQWTRSWREAQLATEGPGPIDALAA
jgi:nicotinamide mononucleotide transporter